MHTEGEEIHESTEEARAASTPNIVRWVLAISLLAAILLLSAIWMFGAATTDDEDRAATVTERIEARDDASSTDSIVSDEFTFDDEDAPDTAAADDTTDAPE